jgi:hypothetical protein
MMAEKQVDDKVMKGPTMMGPLTPAELRRVQRWLHKFPTLINMFSIPEIAERLERQYGPARDE